MTEARYTVSIYHGEGGSLAWVLDNAGHPDEDAAGYYSTIRDGASWREKADAHCARLNERHALRLAGERARLHRHNVEAGRPTED